MSSSELFLVTFNELLDMIGELFDDLHREELMDQDSSYISVISLIVGAYTSEQLVTKFISAHEVWADCYKRNQKFLTCRDRNPAGQFLTG